MKKKVLFVSVSNSARSQMAEELLKKLGGDKFEVESSGFEPTEINPLVIQIMKEEEAIDLFQKKTQSIFDLYKEEKSFRYIVTVSNRAIEMECPISPSFPLKIHWYLDNPDDFTGTDKEKLEKLREIKDQIYRFVKKFIQEYGD